MSGNPVTYAEDILGVHDVHKHALQLAQLLRDAQIEQTEARAEIRAVREQLAEREAIVSIDSRAEHSQATATEFARIIKIDLQQDERCRELRAKLNAALREQDRAEARVTSLERDLRTAQARMTELGGLLVFYGLRSTRSTTTHSNNEASNESEEE